MRNKERRLRELTFQVNITTRHQCTLTCHSLGRRVQAQQQPTQQRKAQDKREGEDVSEAVGRNGQYTNHQ